jgi:hypothetical protein
MSAYGSRLADFPPPEVSSCVDTKHLNQIGGFKDNGERSLFAGRNRIGRIVRAEHEG